MVSTLAYDIIGKDVSGSATLDKLGLGLGKLNAQLDKMKGKRVLVDVDVNDKGAITKINGVEAAAAKADASGKKASSGGLKAFSSGLGVLAAGVAVAGAATVGMATKFDDSTRRMAATSGISVASAKNISQAFLGLGDEYTFSATQMQTAFTGVVAKLAAVNGGALNTHQSLEFMRAAMESSEATGGDLNQTTAALASVMTTFGLKTKDSGKAADVLTKASRLANSPIVDLATGMDKLHARLGVLAPSLADTGTLVADLAQHGITGSRGLLVVNTALNNLFSGSTKTKAEIKDLGLKTTDASGHFVGMGSLIQQLEPKLSKMSDSQKVLAERTLFGSGAAGVMNTIIGEGPARYNALSKSVSETGTAHEAAEKATSGLHGQVEKLESGGKDLAITFGQKLVPAALQVVDKLKMFAEWGERNSKWLLPFVGYIGAFAAAIFVATKAMAAWNAITKVTTAVMKILNITMDANIFALIIIGIVAAVAAFIYLWKNVKGFRDFWKTVGNDIVAIAQAVWHGIVTAFNAVVDFMKKWGVVVLAAILPIVGVPILIIKNWGTISKFFQNLWHDVTKWFTNLRNDSTKIMAAFGIWLGNTSSNIWHTVSGFFKNIYNDIRHWFDSVAQYNQAKWAAIGKFLSDTASNIWHRVSGFFKNLYNDIRHWFDSVAQYNQAKWAAIGKFLSDTASNIWHKVSGFFKNIYFDIRHWFDLVAQYNQAKWAAIGKFLSDTASDIWHKVSGFFKNIWSDVTSISGKIKDSVTKTFTDMKNGLINVFRDIANFVFVNPINFVINTVIDKGINDLVSGLGKVFGQKWGVHVNPIHGFRTGGPIPGGYGGGDTYPIMAEPGEYMVTKEQVRAAGGPGVISAMFGKGGPGFMAGGMVPGYSLGGLIGDIGSGIASAARSVASGFGAAVNWVRGETAGVASGILSKTIYPLADKVSQPGMVGQLPHDIAHKFGDQLVSFLKGKDSADNAAKSSGGGGGGGNAVPAKSGSAAAAQAFALAHFPQFGWGPDQMPSLIKLWNQESGWNANAVNKSSGAYGIPQALGHGHPYNLGDYANQVLWGENYIKGRYGTPGAAWAHEVSNNWYGNGTVANLPTPGVFGESGIEALIPLTRPGAARNVLSRAGLMKGRGKASQMSGERHYHLHLHGAKFTAKDLEEAFNELELKNP